MHQRPDYWNLPPSQYLPGLVSPSNPQPSSNAQITILQEHCNFCGLFRDLPRLKLHHDNNLSLYLSLPHHDVDRLLVLIPIR